MKAYVPTIEKGIMWKVLVSILIEASQVVKLKHHYCNLFQTSKRAKSSGYINYIDLLKNQPFHEAFPLFVAVRQHSDFLLISRPLIFPWLLLNYAASHKQWVFTGSVGRNF
jgi:hypothetical protein